MPFQWFVLRVQSNREDDVREGLEKRLRAEGMESVMPRVLVPTEPVTEIRGGKKKIVERKLYPGYVIVEVDVGEDGKIPDDLWFLVHDTAGVGDFIGGTRPAAMSENDVNRMLGQVERAEESPKLKIDFKEGDVVKIKEGPFENFKGNVEEVNFATGRVRVVITIFNRSTPVDLEYWQIESS